MKKSKTIPVRESAFLVPKPHTVPHEVGIALLIGAAFALGSCFATAMSRKAHASPPNLVVVPEYSDSKVNDTDSDEYPKSELKYQYEPATDEKPILHKKAQKEEVVGGVEYDEGDELVVEPDSEELAVSLAPIIEKDLEQATASPAPSPSPSPGTSGVQQRDIGKRTAEVR
jgi:hypothetical protein